MSGSAITLVRLIRAQTDAIARQFVHDPACCFVGVSNPGFMEQRILAYGGRTEPLDDRPIDRCFVYVDQHGQPELWVRAVKKGGPGGSGYETDWNAFAHKYFSVDYDALDTSNYNIDHLYPETTAYREGMSHVRAMPVPKDSNQAIGRTLEKLMANQKFNPKRVVHKATVVTFAKIAGFAESITLPEQRGQPVDPGIIVRLVLRLQQQGFIEAGELARQLTVHLTRWSVTRLQRGDVNQLGIFAP
jgi:hypothetical protein